MKQLVCEMCGSSDLLKQEGVFVCQHCGAKYSAEEARKLLIDGVVSGSTVKVAGIADNLTRANRAYEYLELGEIEKADQAFDKILEDDNDNFLANLGKASVECVKQQSDKRIIYYLKKAQELSYNAKDEERDFIRKIINYTSLNSTNNGGVNILHNAVVGDNYDCVKMLLDYGADPNVKTLQGRHLTPLYFAVRYGTPEIVDLLLEHGASIDVVSSDGKGIIDANTPDSMIQIIQKHYPDRKIKAKSFVGCYIATAVYGSYDCPQVWTLRRYRDYSLAVTWYGRAFIRMYYAISPILVKWFGETIWFRQLWKGKLDQMVSKLNSKGFEDSPYRDRNWWFD